MHLPKVRTEFDRMKTPWAPDQKASTMFSRVEDDSRSATRRMAGADSRNSRMILKPQSRTPSKSELMTRISGWRRVIAALRPEESAELPITNGTESSERGREQFRTHLI